jgi:hypothetical protein
VAWVSLLSGFLVSSLRNNFRHGAAGSAEFYRDDTGVADNLAAELGDFSRVLLDVFDFDGEVMNTRPLSGRQRFLRFFGIILD